MCKSLFLATGKPPFGGRLALLPIDYAVGADSKQVLQHLGLLTLDHKCLGVKSVASLAVPTAIAGAPREMRVKGVSVRIAEDRDESEVFVDMVHGGFHCSLKLTFHPKSSRKIFLNLFAIKPSNANENNKAP